MNRDNWDKANGIVCFQCGQEAFRFIDGVCLQCYREKETEEGERLGRKREKQYLIKLFNQGKINLRQMREGHLS